MILGSSAQRSTVFGVWFLICMGGAPALRAQQVADRAVVLALPDTFPSIEARAILVQEAGRSVVVLRNGDLTPETLHVALKVLRRVETRPPSRGRGTIIPITGYAPGSELAESRRIELAQLLAELKTRPVVRVGDLGTGRWIRYRVP